MLQLSCGKFVLMGVLRKTRSVKELLQQFDSTDRALSVVYLVAQLRESMNKTTVYRILERLEDSGELHSFNDSSGLMWYAKCQPTCSEHEHHDIHPHFQCKNCGKVECLEVEINVPNISTHKIESASVLLTGHCEACKGK